MLTAAGQIDEGRLRDGDISNGENACHRRRLGERQVLPLKMYYTSSILQNREGVSGCGSLFCVCKARGVVVGSSAALFTFEENDIDLLYSAI